MATAIRKFSGTGSPEGAVSAPPGSTYIQTDGASGSEIWDKATGTGNTGWRVRGSGSGVAVEEDGSQEGTGIDRFDFTSGVDLAVSGTQATVSATSASETAAGISERATQAETDTGTDDARYITPLKLANYSGLGGGSGNISGAYDIESGTYTDAGMSDEFASGTLDAQWTTALSSGTIDFPGQPASSRYDLGTRPGTLLLQPQYTTSGVAMELRVAGGPSNGQSVVISMTLPKPGIISTGYIAYIGLYFNSSTTSSTTGTYRAMRLVLNDSATNSSLPTMQVIADSGSLATETNYAIAGTRLYLRKTRKTVASTDMDFYFYSLDGTSWSSLYSQAAVSTTQMWIRAVTSANASNLSPVFPVHWIRHVASTAHDLW